MMTRTLKWSTSSEAADLFMASMSTLLTQGMIKLTDDKMQLLQQGIATGKLRVVTEPPPLTMRAVVDSDGIERHIFTVTDDRKAGTHGRVIWRRDPDNPLRRSHRWRLASQTEVERPADGCEVEQAIQRKHQSGPNSGGRVLISGSCANEATGGLWIDPANSEGL
jgi:hypothetical protein